MHCKSIALSDTRWKNLRISVEQDLATIYKWLQKYVLDEMSSFNINLFTFLIRLGVYRVFLL